MRKLCIMLISIALIIATGGMASATGGIDSIMVGGATSGNNGQQVDVIINVANTNNIGNIQLELQYNPVVLSVVTTTAGSVITGTPAFGISNSGVVTLGVIGLPALTGSGVLETVRFNVIGNPGDTSQLHLNLVDIGTADGSPMTTQPTLTDATFTVNAIPVDTTPPVTTATYTGTLGNNNWYTTDVGVHLTAADETGGSGVDHTEYRLNGGIWTRGTDFTITTEGTNTVEYRSVDVARNIEATHTDSIKIDKSLPVIVGVVTPPANTRNWHDSDVTVHFSCTDIPSGIASCTSDNTVTTEGAGQYIVGTARDNAGHTASTTVGPINIDKTRPVITIGGVGNGRWYTAPVTPTVTIVETNIFSTEITLDGNLYTPGTPVGSDGWHNLDVRIEDMAGHVVSEHVRFGIDQVPPTITATVPPANPRGWYNAPVTVTFTCNDVTSGIAYCQPPYTFNAEGANQYTTGEARDNAGLTTSINVGPINVDWTPPGPVTNARKWYSSDTKMRLEWTDPTDPDFDYVTISVDGGAPITIDEGIGHVEITVTPGNHNAIITTWDDHGNAGSPIDVPTVPNIPSVIFSVGSGSVGSGGSILLPLSMSDIVRNIEIGSAQIDVTFDKTKITAESIDAGPVVAGALFSSNIDNANGKVTIGFVKNAPGLNVAGIVANIRFRVNFDWDRGTQPITPVVTTLTDPYFHNLGAGTHAGSITVMAGDADGNGIITAADALLYLRAAVGQDISPYRLTNGDDVTCDGLIRADDALKVLRKAVGDPINLNC